MTVDTGQALRREAADRVSEELLVDVARLLVETPSAPGRERRLAEQLIEFGSRRHPGLDWRLEELTGEAAGLLVRAEGGGSRELGIYSHLDTSLTGAPELDAPITDNTAPLPPFRLEADRMVGFGLGVAKGPAACALAGLVAAVNVLEERSLPYRLSLLLASGGTHRAYPDDRTPPPGLEATPGFGAGVRHALERGYRPASVVVAKGGAPGILYEEPGSMFVRVELRGSAVPALLREERAVDGGTAAALGRLVGVLEEWREEFVAGAPSTGQCGREAAVGALEAGLAEKPDILPAVARASAYVVLAPGDDPSEIVSRLRARLRTAPALDSYDLEVADYGSDPGAVTPRDAPVVRLAHRIWEERFGGPPPEIAGWKGSTDGVLFRAAGIDTVRLGPTASPDPGDGRLEALDVSTMTTFAGLYAAMAATHALEAES